MAGWARAQSPQRSGCGAPPYLQGRGERHGTGSAAPIFAATLILAAKASRGRPLLLPRAQGLGVTYLINVGAAVFSRGIAEAKEQPVGFWMAKVFFLGGLALGELKEAVPDPAAVRKAEWRAMQKRNK